ncbi:MAG TPA: helix-turn-helix domain-containing protein [Bacilli bacterium]
MYSVMVADDDYPVLELLSETVDWNGLDLRLLGTYEDGLSAWEQAQKEMPDILITDIGMPKMDGLELISRLKAKNDKLRVAILSCHDEFHYAQQALRLNVQDYLLKDTFNPRELERLLARFASSLQEEKTALRRQNKLQQLVNETDELRKEKWLKSFIYHPMLSLAQSLHELNSFGLLLEGEACLPVAAYLDGYPQAKKRFFSEQTLRFAVSNVLEEVLQDEHIRVINIGYGAKETLLFFCYRPTLKMNIYDQVAATLKKIQSAMKKILKLDFSFIMDEGATAPEQLKIRLHQLVDSGYQRFYLPQGGIAKKSVFSKPSDDLFAYFAEAGADLRELILSGRDFADSVFAKRWLKLIEDRKYAPPVVKDWLFKLLIGQRLKLQSMNVIRPGFMKDTLLDEIGDADSFEQLKLLLMQQVRMLATPPGAETEAGMHPEVQKACQYVALHLDKRISLDEIADHLFLNPSYFSRLFKKETGVNFIEYVTRLKMEKAKELLAHTASSIGSISEMLGYEHPSYFIKIFKSYTGTTPADFRG